MAHDVYRFKVSRVALSTTLLTASCPKTKLRPSVVLWEVASTFLSYEIFVSLSLLALPPCIQLTRRTGTGRDSSINTADVANPMSCTGATWTLMRF